MGGLVIWRTRSATHSPQERDKNALNTNVFITEPAAGGSKAVTYGVFVRFNKIRQDELDGWFVTFAPMRVKLCGRRSLTCQQKPHAKNTRLLISEIELREDRRRPRLNFCIVEGLGSFALALEDIFHFFLPFSTAPQSTSDQIEILLLSCLPLAQDSRTSTS